MRKKVSIEEERIEGRDDNLSMTRREKENEGERKETKYYQMIT